MSLWWRAYNEAVDEPKLLLLSDRAHRAWFNLMCLASIGGGRLPERKVIELKLRLSASKVQSVLDELIVAGLLDQDDAGLAPHNWNGRQYKSDVSTERVKRFRNSQRNVSETPPENRIQNTESKKDAAPNGAHSAEVELFERGKTVLGKTAGGVITNLLKAKAGSIPLARAAIEQASTKQNPREYIGRVIAGPNGAVTPSGNPWPEGMT